MLKWLLGEKQTKPDTRLDDQLIKAKRNQEEVLRRKHQTLSNSAEIHNDSKNLNRLFDNVADHLKPDNPSTLAEIIKTLKGPHQ